MHRRQALKLGGGGLIAAGTGGALLAMTSQEATANVSLSASQDSSNALVLTGESPDGTVERVILSVSGSFTWENLPDVPEVANVRIETQFDGDWEFVAGQNFHEIPETQTADEPYEFNEISGDIIEQTSWEASDFEETTDGETTTTEVPTRVIASIEYPGGPITDQQEYDVSVEVTNTEDPDASMSLDSQLNGTVVTGDSNEEDS